MTHTIILKQLPGVGREGVGITRLGKHSRGKSYYFTGDKVMNVKLENCKLFLHDFTDGYFDLHGKENSH
jgi:hypothetical protein